MKAATRNKWLPDSFTEVINMRYKGFLIKYDYVSDIFRPCVSDFERDYYKDDFKATSGHRCRIYSEDDRSLENILAVVELAYEYEISYDTRVDIVDVIMKFIDDNETYLNNLKKLSNNIRPIVNGLVYSIDNNVVNEVQSNDE